jgi:hypothetical protein
MQAVFEHLEFRLASHDVLSLKRAATAAITVIKGSVWITQDGSLLDHVLLSGQTMRVEGDASLVVAALSAAQVSIAAPRRGHGAGGHAIRIGRSLVAWYLRLSRRARWNVAARGGVAAAL